MKNYIKPIADILKGTSKALYNFALVVGVLCGGGLGILTVVKIENIFWSMRGLKSSSVALNTGSSELLQLSQIVAILAVVILCIFFLSTCLNYVSRYMKKHINE
ncbi:hypothetical protein FX738_08590 [Campylobacter jejuni]|uniref:hypothetical protein n=1 Tax=Staphylococcus caprae TaxID=29380 RepID=UPI00145214CD|nr:hypothetical protein [Staphylococcus caprae]ECO3476006.1 hypothetical protein [Campylobacter jejuni]QJE26600.1 hypothetical protein HHJ99_12585 [Staphylococcus caprae]QJE26625.1 hypothetical protein HHJ99_12710 [Staphylococcus caprae]